MLTSFEKMSSVEVSELTGVPPKTLDYWACVDPQKLPFYKLGRRRWYNRTDVFAWIESRKVGGTA